MATVYGKHISQQESSVPLHFTKGVLMSRSVVPQAPQSGVVNAFGMLFGIILILGIILWSVGAAQGNPHLVIAGQAMFGKGLAAVIILVCCCEFGSKVNTNRNLVL